MMRQTGLILLLVIGLSLNPAWAQNPSSSRSPSGSPFSPAVGNAPPDNAAVDTLESSITQSEGGNVTLDFRDADINNVLRILAYKSGINIVPGPEVTGLVTIQLTDVPWEQALDVILQTYGYGYDRKGNIIVVTTIDNLKKRREDAQLLAQQEPLETKTFILNYA